MTLAKADIALISTYGCDSLVEIVPDFIYHAGFGLDHYRIEITRDLLADGKSPQSRYFTVNSLIYRRLANGEYRFDADIATAMGADAPKVALMNALRAIGDSLR